MEIKTSGFEYILGQAKIKRYRKSAIAEIVYHLLISKIKR